MMGLKYMWTEKYPSNAKKELSRDHAMHTALQCSIVSPFSCVMQLQKIDNIMRA
jgi:hypothetical protein